MSAIRTPTPDAPGGTAGRSFGSTLQGHGPPGGPDDEWRWADVTGQQRLVKSDELRAALASGVIAPNTPVWRRGWRDWRPAYDVPELTTSALAAANGILPNIPPPPLAMVAVQREFEADAALTPAPSNVEAPLPPAYSPAPSRQGQSVSHAPAVQASHARGPKPPPGAHAARPDETMPHDARVRPVSRATEPFPRPQLEPAPIEATTIANVRALTDRDLERIVGKAEPKPRPASPVVIPAISLAGRAEGPPRAKPLAPAEVSLPSAAPPPAGPPSGKPPVPSRKPPPPPKGAASALSKPPPQARATEIEEIDVDDPLDEELSGSLLLADLPAEAPPWSVRPQPQDSVEELSASVLVADPSIIVGPADPRNDLSGGFLLRAEASEGLTLGAAAPLPPKAPDAPPDAPLEATTLVRAPAPLFKEAETLVRVPAPLVVKDEAATISAFAAPAGAAPPPSYAPVAVTVPETATERAYLAPSFAPAATELPMAPATGEQALGVDSRSHAPDASASPPASVPPPSSESLVPEASPRRRSPGVLLPPEGLGVLPFKVPAAAPLALVAGLAVIGFIAALARPAETASRDVASSEVPSPVLAPPAPPAPLPSQPTVATSVSALEPAPAEPPAMPIVATPSTAACVTTGGPRTLAPKALVASGVEVTAVGKRVGVGFASAPHDGYALAVDPASLAVTDRVHARVHAPPSEPIRRVTSVGGPHGFDAVADVDATSALAGRRTVAADPPLELGVANHSIAWSPARADEANALWPLESDGAVDALRAAPLGPLAGDGWAIVFRQGAALYAGVTTGGAHPSPRGPLIKAVGLGEQIGSPAIASADGVVFVAWADRAATSDPWGVRWLRFQVGATHAEAHAFTLPEGGLGGQAMSPGVAAVGAGRFLLLWTEGKVASHQVRGQTLDAEGAPLGAPITLSAAGRNAGQGQGAFLPDGRGVVVYLAARDAAPSAFEVLASPIACTP